MIKVASYCRVSTDKEDQVNSFESQQRYFREYIEHHQDWELYEVYADEGITGTSTKKRCQFNRMIHDAYEGKFQLILTKEVSRFSRNILDTIRYTRELKAIGVGVRFMIDGINSLSPDAELYLSIMASMAQEESRKTSNRVVWGQTRQMERGVVFGRSLLGYDVAGGRIMIEPDGAELVRLIFRKYALEQVSTSEIARFLTQNGYRTHHGSPRWRSSTVIKILNNEKYVGDLIQRKTYTPDFLTHEKRRNNGAVPLICIRDHHEPIITREIWNMTQERLHRNNKHASVNSCHSNRYVFSGKIRCGECGAGFAGRFKYRKDGTRIRRWRCSTAIEGGAEACQVGRVIQDDGAMHMLKTAMQNLPMDSSAIISNVTDLALSAIQAGEQGTGDDPDRLGYEIDRIHRKKAAMLDSYFSGEIAKEDMLSMKARYEQQLDGLHQRIEKAAARQDTGADPSQLRNMLRTEITAILRLERKSEVFCKTILESITVFKDRHMELRLNDLPMMFWFSE